MLSWSGCALPLVSCEHDSVPFDTLIVAAGSHYNYFHHDHWQQVAPDLKTLESALAIRAQILRAFEAAELEPDPERRAAWLTFVSSEPVRPAWRWRARSPRSPATCAPTSSRSTPAGPGSFSSKPATGCWAPSHPRSRRTRSAHSRGLG